MSEPSDLALLMALRVRGRGDAAALARATGCGERTAEAALARLVADGHAAPGRAGGGVALTAAGHDALARLLAGEAGDRAALAAVYARFTVADRALKAAVTAWQLAEPVDAERARAGVMAAAATAGAVAASLRALAPRFAPYAGRLAAAAGAVATGDRRYVASPRVDSLHQVWFELHEDLLVTLGRSREA